MRNKPEPPLDSDQEFELIERSPRYAVRALIRRLVWVGCLAVLSVAAVWFLAR